MVTGQAEQVRHALELSVSPGGEQRLRALVQLDELEDDGVALLEVAHPRHLLG